MKTNEIMNKLSGYKEKLVNYQCQLSQVEKKVQYKDAENFGMYKPLIESEFERLDTILFGLEVSLANIKSMVNGGCAFCDLDMSDIEKMMTEEVKYSEKFIKPTVKEIEEKMESAIEGVLKYE